jgi:hypothetical protein
LNLVIQPPLGKPALSRHGSRASHKTALDSFTLGTTNMMPIKETIAAAFALATHAKQMRDAIAKILPTTVTPRDHAVLHRIYVTLGDMVVGFDQLSDKVPMQHPFHRRHPSRRAELSIPLI